MKKVGIAARYGKFSTLSEQKPLTVEDAEEIFKTIRENFKRKEQLKMSDLAIQLFEDFEKRYPCLIVSMETCIDYVLQTGSTDAHNLYVYVYVMERGLYQNRKEKKMKQTKVGDRVFFVPPKSGEKVDSPVSLEVNDRVLYHGVIWGETPMTYKGIVVDTRLSHKDLYSVNFMSSKGGTFMGSYNSSVLTRVNKFRKGDTVEFYDSLGVLYSGVITKVFSTSYDIKNEGSTFRVSSDKIKLPVGVEEDSPVLVSFPILVDDDHWEVLNGKLLSEGDECSIVESTNEKGEVFRYIVRNFLVLRKRPEEIFDAETHVFCTIGSVFTRRRYPDTLYTVFKWNGKVRILDITNNNMWREERNLEVSSLNDVEGKTLTIYEFKELVYGAPLDDFVFNLDIKEIGGKL